MNSIMANDGVRVNVMGGAITCSNGERYSLVGPVLMGPHGRVSVNCSGIDEAVNIIIGMHGGRKL